MGTFERLVNCAGWLRYKVLALILAALCGRVLIAGHSQSQQGTEYAPCAPEFNPASPCGFSALGMQFQLGADGRLWRISGAGAPVEGAVPLKRKNRVDRVLVGEFERDLLLVYEVGDGESGSGTIARIEPQSLDLKWHLPLPGFNISLGAVEGVRLYQAGFGFVAAVDLSKGAFVWMHRGLYDRNRFSFNAFERPEVLATEILFRETLTAGARGNPRIVRVGKNTGRIRIE